MCTCLVRFWVPAAQVLKNFSVVDLYMGYNVSHAALVGFYIVSGDNGVESMVG